MYVIKIGDQLHTDSQNELHFVDLTQFTLADVPQFETAAEEHEYMQQQIKLGTEQATQLLENGHLMVANLLIDLLYKLDRTLATEKAEQEETDITVEVIEESEPTTKPKRSSLTEGQAREIKSFFRQHRHPGTEAIRDLAEQYGVTTTSITNIRDGRTWATLKI